MAALVGEDPVAGQDGAHPERVQVPADGPVHKVEGEEGGHGGGEVRDREVGAGDGPRGVAEHEVEAVDGAALEALLGDASLDLGLGRKLDARVIGIVRAGPVLPIALVPAAIYGKRLGLRGGGGAL